MSKKQVNTSDIDDTLTLSNGAEVQRIAYDCEVCTSRNEEAAKSEFRIEYEGQQLDICGAHMQEVLNSDGDYKEGGILEDMFNIEEPKG